MRRLRPRQLVELDLDGEPEPLRCHILSVAGVLATLRRVDALTDPSTEPASPSLRETPGLLVFDHRDGTVALRGVAAEVPGSTTLQFVVSDGVGLPERRVAARVELAAEVLIQPLQPSPDDQAEISSAVSNISLTGALVERPPGLQAQPRCRLVIHLPSQHEPIRCQARLVRRTSTHLALAFTDLPEADRLRLIGVISGRRQMLGARRPSC